MLGAEVDKQGAGPDNLKRKRGEDAPIAGGHGGQMNSDGIHNSMLPALAQLVRQFIRSLDALMRTSCRWRVKITQEASPERRCRSSRRKCLPRPTFPHSRPISPVPLMQDPNQVTFVDSQPSEQDLAPRGPSKKPRTHLVKHTDGYGWLKYGQKVTGTFCDGACVT